MTTDFGTTPAGPTARGTNTLAIVSLVCGVLSLFSCCLPNVGGFVAIGLGILAAVLGYVALGQIKRTGEGGRELAMAGAIIGAVVAVLTIVLILLALAGIAALGQLQPQLNPGIEGPAEPGFGDPAGDLGEPAPLGGPDAPVVPQPVVPEPAGE